MYRPQGMAQAERGWSLDIQTGVPTKVIVMEDVAGGGKRKAASCKPFHATVFSTELQGVPQL